MADAIPMLLLLHDRMALVIEDTPVTSEADYDDSDSDLVHGYKSSEL